MGSVSNRKPRKSLLGNDSDEQQLCWTTGSTLLRRQSAESSCQRNFLRSDLAIGVLFQNPGSEVTWRLDGREALAKAWTVTTKSHEMVVLPPHCEFTARCRGSGQGLWLFVDPESLVGDTRIEALGKKPSVDGSWVKDRLAWMILSEIRKECANGFPRGPMFLENAVGVFVSQLGYVRHGALPQVDPNRTLSGARLATVIEYIEANLNRNVTLSELANLVDLTPRYFCAAFKGEMGIPPHQFQIERRIERAKALLRERKLSLVDIALTIGFSSQSHLNDHFRRVVGVTPARYRADTHPNGRGISESLYPDAYREQSFGEDESAR